MVTSLLIATALLQSGSTPQGFTGPKKRAAVTGFDVKIDELSIFATSPSGAPAKANVDIPEPMLIGDGMADMLVTALIDTKRFVVLERKNLRDIEDEIRLEKPKDPPDEKALDAGVLAGRVLGAQLVVRGALTELSYRKTSTGGGGGIIGDIAGGEASFSATATIDLKIVEVSTGRVLDSVKAEGSVTNKSRYIGFTKDDFAFGKSSFDSSPIAKAMRKAIQNGVALLLTRMETVPWEARVATVKGQTLYLNFGSDVGIKTGTELEIFRPGEPVVDPESGLIIGREEDVVLGKCKIRSTTKTMTIADVLSGEDIKPTDGVRLIVKTP